MKPYIGGRVGYSLLSLFLLSLTIFFFVRVTGDPAALLVEPGASEADIAAIHQQFGLDRPLWVQYAIFMSSLFHGDLGQSFYYRMPPPQAAWGLMLSGGKQGLMVGRWWLTISRAAASC
jgi:peptide/nickel transport system permease protein